MAYSITWHKHDIYPYGSGIITSLNINNTYSSWPFLHFGHDFVLTFSSLILCFLKGLDRALRSNYIQIRLTNGFRKSSPNVIYIWTLPPNERFVNKCCFSQRHKHWDLQSCLVLFWFHTDRGMSNTFCYQLLASL